MARSTRLTPLGAALATLACTNPPAEHLSNAPPASAPGTSAAIAPSPFSAREPAPVKPPPATATTVLATFPHDITSFTEGLVYDGGVFYESTGLYGESRLRKIDVSTGRVLSEVKLPATYFGEGLALLAGELFQLTYREKRCFVYDAATLQKRRELTYDGEGWGLTTNGTLFIMSDGSPFITFRDPKTFRPVRRIEVVGPGGPTPNINELEWVDGAILANVWGTNTILRIDPDSGRIVAAGDLAYLPEPRRGATDDDVLNGIAYDGAAGRLFVTGKRWSHIFQIPKVGSAP